MTTPRDYDEDQDLQDDTQDEAQISCPHPGCDWKTARGVNGGLALGRHTRWAHRDSNAQQKNKRRSQTPATAESTSQDEDNLSPNGQAIHRVLTREMPKAQGRVANIIEQFEQFPDRIGASPQAMRSWLGKRGLNEHQIIACVEAVFGPEGFQTNPPYSPGYGHEGQVAAYAYNPQNGTMQPIIVPIPQQTPYPQQAPPFFQFQMPPAATNEHGYNDTTRRLDQMETLIRDIHQSLATPRTTPSPDPRPAPIRRVMSPKMNPNNTPAVDQDGNLLYDIIEEPADTGSQTMMIDIMKLMLNRRDPPPPQIIDTEALVLKVADKIGLSSGRHDNIGPDTIRAIIKEESEPLKVHMTEINHQIDLDRARHEARQEGAASTEPYIKSLQNRLSQSDETVRDMTSRQNLSEGGQLQKDSLQGLERVINKGVSELKDTTKDLFMAHSLSQGRIDGDTFAAYMTGKTAAPVTEEEKDSILQRIRKKQ